MGAGAILLQCDDSVCILDPYKGPIKKSFISIVFSCLAGTGAFLHADEPGRDLPAPAGQGEDETLAKKLRNPVSSLISVPFQNNFDFGGGRNDNGFRHTLNIEPVIPFSLARDWNLVSRSTIPFIEQRNIIPGTSQAGLGDSIERLLLSPTKPDLIGLNWGAGPAFLLPTATNHHLGANEWGAGPALALVRQAGPWTTQVLTYQIFGFSGESNQSFDSTFIQPSVSYTTKTSTTYTLSSESIYNWNDRQFTAPVNATVNQVYKIGGQSLSTSVGVRYYVARPAGAPEWGLRFTFTFLFPESP